MSVAGDEKQNVPVFHKTLSVKRPLVQLRCGASFEFSCNYTKLAMLAFLYNFLHLLWYFESKYM